MQFMEMSILFTSKVKKLLVKLAPWAAVISVGCFVASFLYYPKEFHELEKGAATVKSIEKTIRPGIKTWKWRWGEKSRELESYCIQMGDSTFSTSVYTLRIKEIDSFGISNIVGHTVRYEYNQESDRTNTLFSLSVNGKYVFRHETDWGIYLALIFIFLVTGAWAVWAIVIELKKEGYFEDTKGEPRIFKK
jgi:hypothetical protein